MSNETNPTTGSAYIPLLMFFLVLVSLTVTWYRVYREHDIRFFLTEDDVRTAHPFNEFYDGSD